MANLTIPGLPCYNENVHFLVVANHKYWDIVPVQIGTQVIDQLVATMTRKELEKAGETWRQVHLSTIVSKRSIMDYKGSHISTINDHSGNRYGRFNNTFEFLECCCIASFGYPEHIATARSYGELRPEKYKTDICLWNHSGRQMTLPKQSTVGEITLVGVKQTSLVLK